MLALVQPSFNKVSHPTSGLLRISLTTPSLCFTKPLAPCLGDLFRTVNNTTATLLRTIGSTIFPTLGGVSCSFVGEKSHLSSLHHSTASYSSWETQWSCSTTPATEPARDCQARRLVMSLTQCVEISVDSCGLVYDHLRCVLPFCPSTKTAFSSFQYRAWSLGWVCGKITRLTFLFMHTPALMMV